MEQVSYYMIIATAGHDTTSSSMTGGLEALINNPDQMERLKAEPALLLDGGRRDRPLGLTCPSLHADARRALRACAVTGSEAGDHVLLSYPSANRDEDEFADAFSFDVGRTPNRHLAFGFGVHFCLGAVLARMEIKALLRELLPRLRSIELAGSPSSRARTSSADTSGSPSATK